MHVNKVHRVTTIDRVAADLDELLPWNWRRPAAAGPALAA